MEARGGTQITKAESQNVGTTAIASTATSKAIGDFSHHDDGLALASPPKHADLVVQLTKPKRVRFKAVVAEEGEPSGAPLWDPSEDIMPSLEQPCSSIIEPTPPPSMEELKVMMLERGWCLHQIEYLAQLHELPVLREFATLDRRTHRGEDHRPCLKETHCIAYNTAIGKDYCIRHAADCPVNGCYMVKVPYKELKSVVRGGGVPLVSIHDSPTHGLSLRVHRRGFRANYATISHVWADGLGNPTENALPMCQIKQLQTLLDHEQDSTSANWLESVEDMMLGWGKAKMLWMDTLCIPVLREDVQLRNQCIDAMASIYAGSSRVFVLDRELTAIPLPEICRDLEYQYQITCSVWMCRSWTLQEAMLPGECLFQFDGGIFRLRKSSSLFRFLDMDKYSLGRDNRYRPSLPSSGLYSWEEVESFISTWNGLAGRSTTKAEDLYVVLASCLGFKLRQFRAIKSLEEKVQHMLFSFQELPLSLFFNSGPRLNPAGNHHNRWVPTQVSRHLLESGSTFVLPSPDISKYSDQGMRLEFKPRPLLGQELSVLLVDQVIGPLS
jgi:hypothetical protein